MRGSPGASFATAPTGRRIRRASTGGSRGEEARSVAVAADPRNESRRGETDREVARSIERWFASAARDLPWRRRRTPYRVLVSEVMLQQTQVSRIAERFPRFLRRFPSLKALASASLDEVLAEWEGLGYYRRARLLHQTARAVVAEHRGRMPEDPEDLQRLPGIGRYTAGAIASLAFGRRTSLVDGNVARVILRLGGIEHAIDSPQASRHCWSVADRLVEVAEDPARLNEGLMELGATVCTPTSPACDRCPLRTGCVARASGRQEELPSPKSRPDRRVVFHHAVLLRDARGRAWLEQRPANGLWAGMWQCPTVEDPGVLPAEVVSERLGLGRGPIRLAAEFVHQTTHREVRFRVMTAGVVESMPRRSGRWFTADATRDLAMGVPQRRTLAIGGVVSPFPAARAAGPSRAAARGTRSARAGSRRGS